MENPNSNQVAVFEQKQIRRIEHEGETWFPVVDVIEVLTDSTNATPYWYVLKKREPQLLTICKKLKVQGIDGKSPTNYLNMDFPSNCLFYCPNETSN